jgi:hypothetical protein
MHEQARISDCFVFTVNKTDHVTASRAAAGFQYSTEGVCVDDARIVGVSSNRRVIYRRNI